jgi:hypothetical protein
VPSYHKADAYLHSACIADDRNWLRLRLAKGPLERRNILDMIKRWERAVGLPTTISFHTIEATGITAYLANGGTIEDAQVIANHEGPRKPSSMTGPAIKSRSTKWSES